MHGRVCIHGRKECALDVCSHQGTPTRAHMHAEAFIDEAHSRGARMRRYPVSRATADGTRRTDVFDYRTRSTDLVVLRGSFRFDSSR